MKDSKHIEDLFRNELSGQEMQPPHNSWSGMQSSLDNMRLEHMAKAKLANHVMSPAKSVWHKIIFKLRWERFLRFSAFKFNIYYAGLAVAGVTTGVVITPPQREIYKPQMQQHVVEMVNYEAYEPIETHELTTIELELLASGMSLDEIANRNTEVPDLPDEMLFEESKIASDVNENIESEITDFVIEDKKEQRVLTQIAFNSNIIQDNSNAAKDEENHAVVMTDGSLDNNSSDEYVHTLPVFVNLYLPRLFYLDTDIMSSYQFRKDTLGYDYLGEPIVSDVSFFEQGWYGGVIFLKQDFTQINEGFKDAYQDNENYSRLSYRFGVRFNLIRGNFMMQSGVYFANLNNEFKHTQQHLIIHDDTPHLPFLEYEWPYQSDTVVEYTTNTYNNSYSYVEVPVMFGLHLENEKFACNLKTGPTFNMLSGVNAMLVLSEDDGISTVQLADFKRPGLRWEVSADLIYRISDRFSVYVEPSYVYDVTSMFDKEYEVKSRFKGFTAGLGLYYRF